MMSIVLWSVCAAALLACGWLASAWFHKRKTDALRQQIKAVRNTAAEHANQARRQIAQLQTEIESRKAAVPPTRRTLGPVQPAQVAAVGNDESVTGFVSDAELVSPAGFAHTTITPPDGFASTEIMA